MDHKQLSAIATFKRFKCATRLTSLERKIMKISIVIPTRNRAEYLKYAIMTCLNTQDPNIEIIVSDNNSIDHTREVVKSFNDDRITYINTEQSVSMRQNFEFALRHTSGDYIIYIGDDDGIFKNGLATLRKVLERHQPDVVNWRHITYLWPKDGENGHGGILKFRYRDFLGETIKKSTQNVLSDFCSAKLTNYRDGANIYHGCVSRRLIHRAQEKSPEYFMGQSPDVYTAFSNLINAESFIWLRNPITIAGESPKSNGATFTSKNAVRSEHQNEIAADFISLLDKDPVPLEVDLRLRSLICFSYALLCRALVICNRAHLPIINHENWRKLCREDIQKLSPDLYVLNSQIAEQLFGQLDKNYKPKQALEEQVISPNPLKKKKIIRSKNYPNTVSVADWVDQIIQAPYDPDSHLGYLGKAKRLQKTITMAIKSHLSRATM